MSHDVIRHLDDDLVVRRASTADADALADFHASLHTQSDGAPEPGIGEWVRCLMTQPHPTFSPSDFLIVEQAATGEIASSLCLIDQTWAYDGVPVLVGRPELVATAPAFRRQGLVRELMSIVHEWSRERAQLLQIIIGIPWYYRQFGYEMALDFDGGRTGYAPLVPQLGAGETESHRFRQATAGDVPLVAELVAGGNRRYRMACVRNDDAWRYDIETARGVNRRRVMIVESADGTPVGVIAHTCRLYDGTLPATLAELVDGTSWHDVGKCLIRYLARTGRTMAEGGGGDGHSGGDGRSDGDWKAYALALGTEHPLYDALRSFLPREYPPYAWYARVPDVAAFLDCVAPALDRRLASSDMDRYSGELVLNFYRSGVRLAIDDGRIASAAAWSPERGAGNVAGFPDLTFVQLLLGRRSFEELDAFFPDCGASSDEARQLIGVLFPKQASHVWAVS